MDFLNKEKNNDLKRNSKTLTNKPANKKEVYAGGANGDKVKINAISEVGKSLYEKMQKNLNKFVKSNKGENGNTNEDEVDDVEVIKAKEGNLLYTFFISLIFLIFYLLMF